MPPPLPDAGLVGRRLGPYRVIESLGAGGMGAVYLAEDERLGRQVALKVLSPEMAAHPEKLQRFEREARTVASLSHPGIVTLHAIEEADGLRFLAMEHVAGETLGRLVPARGFPVERLLPLAIAITDAVAAAHRQGVLHRDLKPENVMLTAEGRVKVLDFGLAKLRPEASDEPDSTTRETQSVTQDGRIVGTVAYMSPEQAQGLEVDSRSDIFSLGILLYEMATGERPFKGATNLSVLSAILKEAPRPLGELRADVPRPLARMIQRCLEKRPEDRYQSASDLRRDLEDLKRDVDSGEMSLATTVGRRRLRLAGGARRGWALGGVLGLALLAATGAFFALRDRAPASSEDARRSLAVFFFDNLSGEPQLDWLRTGLTDMLVTNLAQSSNLRVLSTSRLYQLLDEAGHRDESVVPARVVEAVSRRARTTTALVGSFVRAGQRIRIQASLQDPLTGEVLASERVEGDADSGLFALVDELTGRVRSRLEARSRLADRDAKIEDVTTSSIEALKAYSEGSRLHERLQEHEARGHFERAVAIDPGFAMALAKLSVVHANLGDLEKARAYSARAVERAGSLPAAERFYIQGRHASLDPASTEKAIAAYRAALEASPDHWASRNNLAQLLLETRRYREALAHLEELRRRGMGFPGSYLSLAEAYLATGQPTEARAALAEYVRDNPDSAAGHENLGMFELAQGRLDAAVEAFDKAVALAPGESLHAQQGRIVARALADRWDDAEALARLLAGSADPRASWQGHAALAMVRLHRGDVSTGRKIVSQGSEEGRSAFERAGARLFGARLELELGRAEAALAQADLALATAGAEGKLRAEADALRAICLTRLGRSDEATASATRAEAWLATIPPAMAAPLRLQLQGELALARGDAAGALGVLEKAASLAQTKTISFDAGSVEIQYTLAKAALAAGHDEQARRAFARVVAAGPARVLAPLAFVRSLARLAALEEKAGRAAEARRLYERYLGYWRNGEVDRAEVARARARLAVLERGEARSSPEATPSTAS